MLYIGNIFNLFKGYFRRNFIESYTLVRIWKKRYHVVNNNKKNRYANNVVISALDSLTYSCGFADKLRGIVSSYAYAKAQNRPFAIVHQSPFLIDDYFVPNEYDWREKRDKISWNLRDVAIVLILDSKRNKDHLIEQVQNKPKQIHIYTNTDLIEDINLAFNQSYTFDKLFNELFKPSPCLQKRICDIKSLMSEKYISISLRFVNLLGDFQEKGSIPLIQDEQEALIKKCIDEIHKIRKENSQVNKILITADSMKFLGAVSKFDFVYIVPGESGHSGYKGDSEIMMKTMLDFLFISYAEKVYLIKSEEMYASHFAETAASSSGRQFVKWLC